MFVVLASRFDAGAADLVRRSHGQGVRLLTCEGLSRRGWSFDPAVPDRGTLVLDEECVPVRSLRGLVSLLPSVDASELPQIIAEEREYIAGEMMAFLVAWLSRLPCPVLNRPSPLCLTGPRLHHEQWLRAASKAGLPVRESVRQASRFEQGEACSFGIRQSPGPAKGVADMVISVVAGRCILSGKRHPDDATVSAGLARLAAAVGAGLLTADFVDVEGRLHFSGAVPAVDVSRGNIARVVLQALGVSA